MMLKIFTVYDSKTEAYMQPQFMQSTGQALRAFEDAVNDDTHPFHKHAADFTLFELGTFDDQTGVFSTYAAKKSLTCGNEIHAATSFNKTKAV